MKKTTGMIEIKVSAPRSMMHDIMRTALQAGDTYGIGYWAFDGGNEVELVENESLFPVKLRFKFADKHAIEKVGGVVQEIDERDIARAMGLALGGVSDAGAQWLAGNGDGPSADALVQLAVFGEMVYG